MLTREQKKKIVEEMAEKIRASKGVVLSDFQGLPTKDIQELRSTLRKEGVSYKVVKLSLLKLAMKKAGLDVSGFSYQVPLSVALSADDEILPAKILDSFARKKDKLKITAGVLDKMLIDAEQVKMLAALPGRTQLRGQVVSVLAAPLRGLASVLIGNVRGLINVLNAKIKTQNAK